MQTYPKPSDLDARLHIMKSLNLDRLPEIDPNSIDESTGIIAKTKFYKNYNLEEMLENTRRD